MNSFKKLTLSLGKILIIITFLYFGVESILNPSTFAGLIPSFISQIINPETAVMIHGGIEVICGLFILFGLGGLIPYLILILSFFGVVFSVSGLTQVRDIGILGGLLLLLSEYISNKKETVE